MVGPVQLGLGSMPARTAQAVSSWHVLFHTYQIGRSQ